MKVQPTAINKLASTLHGRILEPSQPDFDAAREIWNRLYERRPALVVRCESRSDVAKAVRFAREHDLEIAVKGGGHHVAGHAACDGGLLLDLSRMRGVRIDPQRRIATALGGCTWADFDPETQEFGLACTGPIVSMTGLPGFLLGGGFGWLHRRLGLGCDHLVAADLVNAEGEYVRATMNHDPELLWGLRGAGWNFGVVTSMELKLDPVGPQVLAGVIYFPIERFAGLTRFHQASMADAPEDLTTWLILRLGPRNPAIPEFLHGQPVCAVGFCHCGGEADAEGWANRIRALPGAFADSITWKPYVDWQRALDGRWGNGFYNDWRSFFFDDLQPECVEVLLEHMMRLESPLTDIKIPHLGGAIAREPVGGASFGNRRSRYCLVIQGRWSEPAGSDKHLQWSKDLQSALRPFSASGAYVNFLGRDEDSRIVSAYGEEGYRRLAILKDRMDPDNIFHLNPNIGPQSGRVRQANQFHRE
ncbi:MAG TPA: FAD-binding oxidoreductase [Bryobacteraceae bacterium]|nr:FAD-binding oxidoreductase [Bryobacteraceae bacterium]